MPNLNRKEESSQSINYIFLPGENNSGFSVASSEWNRSRSHVSPFLSKFITH